MSKDTYKRVEAGLSIRDSSYVKVDKALQWAPGSATGILEGGDAIAVKLGAPGPGLMVASVPNKEVKDVITTAIVAVSDTLTAREIRDISDRVLAELRQLGVLDDA